VFSNAPLYPIGPEIYVSSLVLRPSHVRWLLRQGAWPQGSDVASGITIRIGAVAASDTSKVGLIGPVGTCCMSTLGAGLTRLARVYKNHRNAKPISLITNLVYQVAESPTRHHAVETLGPMQPIADAIQTFQNDNWIRILCSKVNDLATNFVIQISHPARLAASLVSYSICTVMHLIPSSKVRVVFSFVPRLFAIEEHCPSRGYNGSVSHYTQINADKGVITGTSGRHDGDANRQHYVPLATTLKQFGIALCGSNSFSVSSRNTQGEPDVAATSPGRNSQNETISLLRNGVTLRTKADSLTVIHFRERTMLLGFPQSVVRTSQGDGGVNHHAGVIGGQVILLANWIVDFLVQAATTTRAFSVRSVQPKLHCPSKLVGHIIQPPGFLSGRLHQLNYNAFCTVHELIVLYLRLFVKSQAAVRVL
jgi:hypothetical protein